MADTAPIKYRAFLSYSHRDATWAKWLHGALEGYRIDWDLVGRITAVGPVPKTLRPIFLDREDFAAGHSLTGQTLAALESSRFLIVICSPNAVASKYVNEEIRRFKVLGRSECIVPVIVDGEPGDPERECFPPALRFKVGPEGSFSGEADEPMAADARPQADGKEIAKQKVIAGLLGLGLDQIVQRGERARKRRNRFWAALAGVLLFLTVTATASAVYAYQKLLESEERLDQAIEIAYGFVGEASSMSARFGMPTELTLALVRRAEVALKGLLAKAPASPALRYREAQMLLEFASQYRKLGRLEDAIQQADQARELLAQLVDEHRDNLEWQFHLSAAYDQLALLLTFQGDTDGALRNYEASAATIERVTLADPDNIRWQIALLWSRRVVGEFLLEQGSSSRAMASYQKGMVDFQRFTKSHPEIKSGPGGNVAMAKMIDSWGNLLAVRGSYDASLKMLQSNLSAKKDLLAQDSNSFTWQFELRDSYRYAGNVLVAVGSYDEALDSFRHGLAIDQREVDSDPKFVGSQRSLVVFGEQIARALLLKGSPSEALERARATLAAAERLALADGQNVAWQAYIGEVHSVIADSLMAQGDAAEALNEYRTFHALVSPLMSTRPQDLNGQMDFAATQFGIGTALQSLGRIDEARNALRAALAVLDRLASIDPAIVRYRTVRLMVRWHLAECGDATVGSFSSILADVAKLNAAKQLTADQQAWLAEARLKHAGREPP